MSAERMHQQKSLNNQNPQMFVWLDGSTQQECNFQVTEPVLQVAQIFFRSHVSIIQLKIMIIAADSPRDPSPLYQPL